MLDMSEERASAVIIAGWVGYRTRNMVLNMSKNLHFGYELQIFEERKRKRSLVFGLLYHLIFMCLLFGAFTMQHGSSVSDRFQLVESIKSEISGIQTPVVDFGNSGGVTFDKVSNLDEIWDWSDALIGTLGGQSRVYMRTYNQIVGSMRIESTRVSNASCPYKSSAWNTYISGQLRTRLSESEARHPECYGHSSVGALVTPYGPPHDPSKWLADDFGAGFTYKVDLGKDPRYAGYKLQEMRRDGFLSKSTRRVAISMAVYNNALPMICLVKLVFEMSPTGLLKSMYEIEAINPMPYTSEMFWLQATFELLVMIFALLHVFGEILDVRHLMRKLGRSKGLYDYFSTFWNAMNWMEFALLAVFYVFWFKLLVDISRDVDLDTQDYVDLEEVASDYKVYNLLFNTILLLSLFSMLRFTELDHRMALLTRSISESLSDLGPFMILFSLFLCIFATIGYLLYGSVLYEWATWFQSIITAIDIIMGNYQYVALQKAVPENSPLDSIVSVVYFYVYFFLMMLITLNIVIAILMDGYASVKEKTGSDSEVRFTENVGGLLSIVFGQSRDRGTKSPLGNAPWSEARWIELLYAVRGRRKSFGGIVAFGHVSSLMADLRTLKTHGTAQRHIQLSPEELLDMAWQIKHAFQDRPFAAPPDITNPNFQPGMADQLGAIGNDLTRTRYDMLKMLTLQQALQPAPKALAAVSARSSDGLGSSDAGDSARATSGSSDALCSTHLDAQQLWELVLSQQQLMSQQQLTIIEQQKTISRHQAVMLQAHMGVAARTVSVC